MGPVVIQEKENFKERKHLKKKWKQEKLLKQLKKVQDDVIVDSDKREEEGQGEIPHLLEISTLSIAVPGSILENAQSAELRTYLAGQIARAASIFQVDEVVVFDDIGASNITDLKTMTQDDGVEVRARACCIQLARILQYLECPQYLRKQFFPIHKDLQYAGTLNPLDAPHHLRQNDTFEFREGVVSNCPVKPGKGSMVNVGLLRDVQVDRCLTPGLRVTVKLLPSQPGSRKLHGVVVSPHLPRASIGVYWGYSVRVASSLSSVFSQAPYSNGYDLTIGTSDKGISVDKLKKRNLQPYKHAIIVFGGLNGLEAALEADELLKVDDPALLFDHYINTCPKQGSRTIRTEEAILISLSTLRTKLVPELPPKDGVSD
ncbi:putative methyltransferase C9orf114 [Anabrus simplex]|uniref:putative methyltransferase C9orf114 n=1 Tax=Anabrus simplex TaxID=316456 RepID=UPI0034DD3171